MMGRAIVISDIFDSYELSDTIKEFFGVDINETDTIFSTLGELESHVWAQCRPNHDFSGNCLSAMSFYRVRAALSTIGVTVRVSPKHLLASLDVTPRQLAGAIRKNCDPEPLSNLDPLFWPTKFPADMTAGDYAKEMAGLNVQKLCNQGGGVRGADIGNSLRAIAARLTGQHAKNFNENSKLG